jgi:hypothetical protein
MSDRQLLDQKNIVEHDKNCPRLVDQEYVPWMLNRLWVEVQSNCFKLV